jgi:hypothetical protein
MEGDPGDEEESAVGSDSEQRTGNGKVSAAGCGRGQEYVAE